MLVVMLRPQPVHEQSRSMSTLFQVHSALLAFLLSPVGVGAAGTASQPTNLATRPATGPSVPADTIGPRPKIDRGTIAIGA
jgi:hypothetical protein